MIAGKIKVRAELRSVERALLIGPTKLREKLASDTRAALRPIRAEVRAETATLPSGYRATMARALRVRSVVELGASVRASVTVSGQGHRRKRDVAAVNRGTLRHPVFANRDTWASTTVPPGFVDRPADRLRDRLFDAAERAVDEFVDDVVGR